MPVSPTTSTEGADEESLEELERQLAGHHVRKEEVQHFVDPRMRKLQTRWVDDRITKVEEKIRIHGKKKLKSK